MTELGLQSWVYDERMAKQAPSEEHFSPIRCVSRYHRAKPDTGGFWTSSWDNGSGWTDWRIVELSDGGPYNVWLLTPDPQANVYEIDTYNDLARLVERFPGRPLLDKWEVSCPAWERVAEVYDGVHLTDAGQWATRLTHPCNLYGWDCESTLWFRWKFTEVVHHGLWTPPSMPCDEGEDCWRCDGNGIHYIPRVA